MKRHPLAAEFAAELDALTAKYMERVEKLRQSPHVAINHAPDCEGCHAQNSIVSELFSEGIRACYGTGVELEQALGIVRLGYSIEENGCPECAKEKLQ